VKIPFVRMGVLVAFLLGGLTPVAAQGVNLSGWFQAPSAKQLPFSRYTAQDFAQLKSLGVTWVRLPLNLVGFAGPAPDYTLDPRLWLYLDQAVSWANDQGFTLLLDNHSDPLDARTAKDFERFLTRVWTQLSQRYRDQPPTVYYELQNEPHDIAPADWARIQSGVVKALRRLEPKRTLVVTGAEWGGIDGLLKLPPLADQHLLYSFHFYDPLTFTHQGADWAGMADTKGITFGAPAAQAQVVSALDRAVAWGAKNGVPLFCGEFGVFNRFAPAADRERWYQLTRQTLEDRNLPWAMWDYRGSFGLFAVGSAEGFASDVVPELAAALGFTWSPTAAPTAVRPWTGGVLYNDSWGPGTVEGGWNPTGSFDYAAPREPQQGRVSLTLANPGLYDTVSWEFRPLADLSALASTGELRLWARSSAAAFSFDVRLMMVAASGQLPWRLGSTIDQRDFPGDGRWHPLALKLTDLKNTGAWDGTWHNPQPGVFRWDQVARLEIVAETRALPDVELGFDALELR